MWVVERAAAEPNGKAAPQLDGASAPAIGVGAPVVAVRAVVFGKVHDVLTNADNDRIAPLGHGDPTRRR